MVIGRKNWIFLGHPQAAAGRLKLFSMVSSAHRHHSIVEDYLADVLYKLSYAQQLEPHLLLPGSVYLQSLLPDHWALANPKSVCQERREEAESVAERKLIRTLKRKLAVPATIAAGNQETRSSSTAAPAVSAN